MVFDRNGYAFLVYIEATGASPTNGSNAVIARRSIDGGATWSGPIVIDPGDPRPYPQPGCFVDKPWIAAADAVYIPNPPEIPAINVYQVYVSYLRAYGGTQAGAVTFSRSLDQGLTYSTGQIVSDRGGPPQGGGPPEITNYRNPTVAASWDRVYVVWTDFRNLVQGMDLWFNVFGTPTDDPQGGTSSPTLSAREGGRLALSFQVPGPGRGLPYRILGAAEVGPAARIREVPVPLREDALFEATATQAAALGATGLSGIVPASGRLEASLTIPGGTFSPGDRLRFMAVFGNQVEALSPLLTVALTE